MDSFTHAQNIIQSLTLETLDENINLLKEAYSKIFQDHAKSNASKTLTKMIHSLLSYIESKKEKSHHNAIPSLISLSAQLKKVTLNTTIEQNEINQIVKSEIRKYKALKQEITSRPILEKNDIDDLSSVILAMDWEITDSTINNFDRVVKALSIKVGNHKIFKSYLTIIHNTGRYIGAQKAQAHTDSISFLKTIFERFEYIALSNDLSLLNKKENLDEDIKRFQQFKQKISAKKEKQHFKHSSDDDSITPALSHISGVNQSSTDSFTPVTQLPDEDDSKTESVPTVLDGKANAKPGSRDVMDDLFNLKESPADELLDAIHLMGVHGSNPDQATQMLDRTEKEVNSGVTKFTPERIDNEPISEIGDRLDEFFNLENTSALTDDDETNQDQEPDNNLHTIKLEGDDGIVPFDFEDKEHPDDHASGAADQKETQDINLTLLNRLKDNINSSQWLTDEPSFLSIKNDISLLGKNSETAVNKNQLLEIMNSILDVAHIQSKADQDNSSQAEPPSPAPTQSEQSTKEKSKGFLGKIKNLFGS